MVMSFEVDLAEEVGLLVDRAELEVLVELGGGAAAGRGRSAALAALERTGVVRTTPDGPVLDETLEELARIIALPDALLDVRVSSSGVKTRLSYALTAFGGVRLQRVGESVLLTPFLTEQLLLRLRSELQLDPGPGSPGASYEVQAGLVLTSLQANSDEEEALAIDGLVDGGFSRAHAEDLLGTVRRQRYTASAITPEGVLTWLVGPDRELWVLPTVSDADPQESWTVQKVSTMQLLGAIARLVQPMVHADHLYLGVPDPAVQQE